MRNDMIKVFESWLAGRKAGWEEGRMGVRQDRREAEQEEGRIKVKKDRMEASLEGGRWE